MPPSCSVSIWACLFCLSQTLSLCYLCPRVGLHHRASGTPMAPDVCWDCAVEPSCCQRFDLLLMCPLCNCSNCCPCPSRMPPPVLCCAICGWNCSVPREVLCPCNLPFLLNPLPGTEVLTWSLLFPFYSVLCESFLQPWLYKRLSASLQLVFSENFPHVDVSFTCSRQGGDFHVLLLGHFGHTHLLI